MCEGERRRRRRRRPCVRAIYLLTAWEKKGFIWILLSGGWDRGPRGFRKKPRGCRTIVLFKIGVFGGVPMHTHTHACIKMIYHLHMRVRVCVRVYGTRTLFAYEPTEITRTYIIIYVYEQQPFSLIPYWILQIGPVYYMQIDWFPRPEIRSRVIIIIFVRDIIIYVFIYYMCIHIICVYIYILYDRSVIDLNGCARTSL